MLCYTRLTTQTKVPVEARGSMNRGKTSLLAASCLLLSLAAQATTSSTATTVRHRHHSRTHATSQAAFTIDGPILRSSAALVLDETHSTVLYSRNADVAMPIA